VPQCRPVLARSGASNRSSVRALTAEGTHAARLQAACGRPRRPAATRAATRRGGCHRADRRPARWA
jgi:hypothetical protein